MLLASLHAPAWGSCASEFGVLAEGCRATEAHFAVHCAYLVAAAEPGGSGGGKESKQRLVLASLRTGR